MDDQTTLTLEAKDSCIIFHDNGEISINIPAQEDNEILLPSASKVLEVLMFLNGDFDYE